MKNYVANYFSRQVTITITEIFVERNNFACASVSMVKTHQLQLHTYWLRELFWLSGYNYNYMKYSHANYLRNDFVDHGFPRKRGFHNPDNVHSSGLWWQVSVEHLDQEARNIVGEEACERSPLHFIEAMGLLSNLVATSFHVKSSRPFCSQKVWRKITLVKFKANLREI